MGARVVRLLLLLTLAGIACDAHAAPALRVRRLPGTPSNPGGLPPEYRAEAEARIRQWRSFDDVIVGPGARWTHSDPRRTGAQSPFAAGKDLKSGAPVTNAPIKTKRVAFIRIDFLADRGGPNTSGDGRFDLSGPDTLAPPIDRAPHNRDFYLAHLEALKRYYATQTYGQVAIEGDVWPRSPNGAYSVSDLADFGPWRFSTDIYGAAVHMFRTMILAADSQSVVLGDRIPWDQYGYIVLIHAGSDFQSDVRQDSPQDIPSFTIGVPDTDAVVVRNVSAPGDSFVIDRASLVPETINQDERFGAINGVLAHECGHLFFGFADIYDVNSGLPTVGFWSLMDTGNNLGIPVQPAYGPEIYATGIVPPAIDPLQRYFACPNLALTEVSFGDTVNVTDVERHGDILRVRMSSDEDLLIENRYVPPASVIELDQDPVTRVVLGPRAPETWNYDALLPGGGVLVWHVDSSVIPFTNSLRTNPDFGFNSDPFRQGLSVIEADALDDLGDFNSPYWLASYRDPWYAGNATVLSDTTRPKLVTHAGTKPHVRLEVFGAPDTTMRLYATRTWLLPGFPLLSSFPSAGPQLLAIDADGDGKREVCWAGGDPLVGDTLSLFAVRASGAGLAGPDPVFATLDAVPFGQMAAIATGNPATGLGPSLFAVSTIPTGPTLASDGGRVWLFDHTGATSGAWPAALPSIVTTPPVLAGAYPNANVIVGCADGRVYALNLDGSIRATSAVALAGGVRGKLAVTQAPGVPGTDGLAASGWAIAAGGGAGDVGVFLLAVPGAGPDAMPAANGWPRTMLATASFDPDFLWLDFDGAGSANPTGCGSGAPELVVHHADLLWGFCLTGTPLAGFGHDVGDTLIASLGAGDPDGDGYPEVLTQNRLAQVAFVNASGYPSPGWPRALSTEGILAEKPELTFPDTARSFPTSSAPLAVDPVGDGRTRVVALTATGVLAALDGAGRVPEGWPLATGSGALGTPVVSDLDGDGHAELVAPDRLGLLWAYTLPGAAADPLVNPWPMLGGDPGRTFALARARTSTPAPYAKGPLVSGSLKAFPNPARQKPVSLAFQLTEPADVEIRILDTSGHEVARLHHDGQPSDNRVIWDPGGAPAGLYLARVRIRGNGSERTETLNVGVIK